MQFSYNATSHLVFPGSSIWRECYATAWPDNSDMHAYTLWQQTSKSCVSVVKRLRTSASEKSPNKTVCSKR